MILLLPTGSIARDKVKCNDGDHYLTDIKDISIKYECTQMAATINGLAVIRVRLTVDAKALQLAAVTTQKMNEYIKALVVGYNTCAITKEQYHEAMDNLLVYMMGDALSLEQYRMALLDKKKVDNNKLNKHLKNFEKNLRKFVKISGKELDYKRLASIIDEEILAHTSEIHEEINRNRNEQAVINNELSQRLVKLEQANPFLQQLTTPNHITELLSSNTKELAPNILTAQTSYEKGYSLMEQYNFRESVPYFQTAMSTVKLPDFNYALGSAYLGLSNLDSAQKVLFEGLNNSTFGVNAASEARLKSLTSFVLLNKGDLTEAQSLSTQALGIDTKIYGPDHPNVATDMKTLSQILQAQGKITSAINLSTKALSIDMKYYGFDHSLVATDMKDLGQLCQTQGNSTMAIDWTKKALSIDTQLLGEVHPTVSSDLKSLGQIYQTQGNLAGALDTSKQVLGIDTQLLGSNHLNIAIDANNIGQILKAQGDLPGALKYTQQALNIYESNKMPDDPFAMLLNKQKEDIEKSMADNFDKIQKSLGK
jgi:tetratricopeptide (TPR) repeat protein